jgi:hypothetical protein
MNSKNYTLWLGGMSLVLLLLIYIFDSYLLPLPRAVYALVPAFAALTWAMHRLMLRANQTSPQMFLTAFMAGVTVKLLTSLAFLTVYILKIKEQSKELGIALFIVYMAFTVLEALFMQGYLRKKPKN